MYFYKIFIFFKKLVGAYVNILHLFRLFFREVSQDETAKADNKFNQIDTETTAIRLINLRPNTQYSMYAVTVSRKADENTNRTSDPSETLIAWTDPALPAFVEVKII